MLKKIVERIVRYEHREWARLHKVHIGLSVLVLIVAGGGVTIALVSQNGHAHALGVKQVSHETASSDSAPQSTNQPSGVAQTAQSTTVATAAAVSNNTAKPAASTPPSGETVKPAIASGSTNAPASTGSSSAQTGAVPNSPNMPAVQPMAVIPANGGYPAKWADAPMDSVLDDWSQWNREGTSYVAFKVNQAYPNAQVSYLGNAKDWPSRTGYPTGSTPKADSVFVLPAGPYGEVFWVESVSGTKFTWSTYNYDKYGAYSTGTFDTATFSNYSTYSNSTFIYFNNN